MAEGNVSRRRGLLAMVGSLLWVATDVLYGFTGGGGSRGEAVLRTVLMNPALLLFIVGLMGFHERQARRSGRLGLAGYAVCLLGTGLLLLGNVTEIWVYKYLHGALANDLQFTSAGLWVLDQVDQPGNRVFLVKPETGTVLREIMTDAIHGSGITFGNGALWIGSTKMKDPKQPPATLKVDPSTGRTLASWRTPGSGFYGRLNPETDTPSGAHGLKWVDGKYLDPDARHRVGTRPAVGGQL